ncbi:MAG: nucleoside triphosphate pyrophosphohydrolase [Desulfuromonas sp.]|nr:MAG: nucleoside triphosphate pyrophosphohydrolase [Desulfuromonas sp.]
MTISKHAKALNDLLETMATLRSPAGCPWDAQQTPLSLTPYILEEACELIDAIESGDDDQVLAELGDLLLQVVFLAQIYTEYGQFGFTEIAQSIHAKLLRRHPHVFGDRRGMVTTAEDLDRQWEQIKKGEIKGEQQPKTFSCLLPKQLPALQRAQKLVQKLTKAGLDIHLKQINSEARPEKRKEEIGLQEDAIGLALLRLIIAADNAGVDSESALRRVTSRIGKTPLPETNHSDKTR